MILNNFKIIEEQNVLYLGTRKYKELDIPFIMAGSKYY